MRNNTSRLIFNGTDALKKVIFLLLFIFNFIPLVLADGQQLIIATNTLVTEEGRVRIYLT